MFLDEFDATYENMMNPEMKSNFIYSKYSHMKKFDIETIIRLFNNAVGVAEQLSKKDFCNFSLKEVLDLFERNEWQHANTFAHNKSILKHYIYWCKSQNIISSSDMHPIERISKEDIVGTIKFDRQYFKSFDDQITCIEEVYNNADVDDSSQFLIPKLTFCLSSLIFTKEEIRFMEKDDVDIENRTIKSKISGYEVTELNDYIIKLLKECLDIEGYSSRNRYGVKAVTYQNNNYLIRIPQTARLIENEPVNDVYFNNIASKFRRITSSYSPTSKYYEKGITCESIYNSGIYFKIYDYEQNNNLAQIDFKTLSKISRTDENDLSKLSLLYSNYAKWRKYFYGN